MKLLSGFKGGVGVGVCFKPGLSNPNPERVWHTTSLKGILITPHTFLWLDLIDSQSITSNVTSVDRLRTECHCIVEQMTFQPGYEGSVDSENHLSHRTTSLKKSTLLLCSPFKKAFLSIIFGTI